jgi:hypothetical protein
MELKDIKKSLSEMDDEELRALLLDIRGSRRTSKKPTPVAKAKAAPKASSAGIDQLLKGISSKEDYAKLLKELGG